MEAERWSNPNRGYVGRGFSSLPNNREFKHVTFQAGSVIDTGLRPTPTPTHQHQQQQQQQQHQQQQQGSTQPHDSPPTPFRSPLVLPYLRPTQETTNLLHTPHTNISPRASKSPPATTNTTNTNTNACTNLLNTMQHSTMPRRTEWNDNAHGRGYPLIRARRPLLQRHMDPMETVELAHHMLRSPAASRANAHLPKLNMLCEIFPSVDVTVLEDVLATAQFRVDVAAAMVGELTRDPAAASNSSDPLLDRAEELVFVSVNAAGEVHEMDAHEQWHEVAASRPALQQWELVQDDWEVVDAVEDSKLRSFADVLRSSGSRVVSPASASPSPSMRLTALTPKSTPSVVAAAVKTGSASIQLHRGGVDDGELCVKSFGTRKRRHQRKYRN